MAKHLCGCFAFAKAISGFSVGGIINQLAFYLFTIDFWLSRIHSIWWHALNTCKLEIESLTMLRYMEQWPIFETLSCYKSRSNYLHHWLFIDMQSTVTQANTNRWPMNFWNWCVQHDLTESELYLACALLMLVLLKKSNQNLIKSSI